MRGVTNLRIHSALGSEFQTAFGLDPVLNSPIFLLMRIKCDFSKIFVISKKEFINRLYKIF